MAVNKGWTQVTLVAGVGTGTWRRADQAMAPFADAEVVELDYDPVEVTPWSQSGTLGNKGLLNITATKNGVTVASSNNADTSVIRLWGTARIPPSQFA